LNEERRIWNSLNHIFKKNIQGALLEYKKFNIYHNTPLKKISLEIKNIPNQKETFEKVINTTYSFLKRISKYNERVLSKAF